MKVDIRDVQAVRAIRPADAAQYLRANGWTPPETRGQTARPAQRAAIWQKRLDGEEFEVLLPMDASLRDYALRMGDMLTTLSVAEKRSQLDVYRDLLMITSDIIRIRIADSELDDGTLPIEENAQIAQKARDLVLAAACAATETRPAWHHRKPTQAAEYVRRVRIGQSERGSYVVTVLSRVTPLLHTLNDKLFELEPPYERRVTELLGHSLVALDRAAERAVLTQEMAAFDEAVPHGVNANLCDAVVGLWGGDEVQRMLEFSFSWSPTRPVTADAVHKVAISADRIPVIREAGRQLRDRAPLPEFDLSGPVVRLDRPDGAPVGKVTVVGIVEDRHVRVAVELGDPHYHKAVRAHDERKILRMSGTLLKEGRGYALRNPSDIVVEDEQLRTSMLKTPEVPLDMLARILPRDAQEYVRSRGWQEGKRIGNLMVYNRPEPDSLDQVLVPVDPARPDYAERMGEAVERLASFEGRDFRLLASELLKDVGV